MNGPGNQFFTGTAFPFNQHTGTGRRNFLNNLEYIHHFSAFADDISKAELGFHGFTESAVFLDHTEHVDGFFDINDKPLIIKRF